MAIQIPNAGTGNGATGDNEFVLWTKVINNFSGTTHAASRLVGTATSNVMEVGAFGLGMSGGSTPYLSFTSDLTQVSNGFYAVENGAHAGLVARQTNNVYKMCVLGLPADNGWKDPFFYLIDTRSGTTLTSQAANKYIFYTTANVTKDANGFLKGASPVVDMYDNKIDLNQDAEQQGGITFEKLGVGDYLIKGSLGFSQDGWHIETPKDTNGNILVAVVETQLENNDLSIKAYAKRFDDETGDIVANLAKPRDIPTGRFISLRLHELPKEPPVMPTATETQLEV